MDQNLTSIWNQEVATFALCSTQKGQILGVYLKEIEIKNEAEFNHKAIIVEKQSLKSKIRR